MHSASTASQLAAVVGIVFQFPERHFLGNTIYEVQTLFQLQSLLELRSLYKSMSIFPCIV